MSEKDRFRRIEGEEVSSGLIRKIPEKKDRFERLEVEQAAGDASAAPARQAAEPKYFPCPKCNRNNQKSQLYCIYCGQVFEHAAEVTGSSLRPYEIRCPSCGKVCNRNQKTCLWCGHHFVPTDEDILKEGDVVELVINGVRYTSEDRYLPDFARDALVRLKKGTFSPQEADRDLKVRQAESLLNLHTGVEKKQSKVIGLGFLAAGGFFLWLVRVLAGANLLGAWALMLGLFGLVSVIVGLLFLAVGMEPAELDEMLHGVRRRGRF